jgi:hypothetical protein
MYVLPTIHPDPSKPQKDPIAIDVGIDSKVGIRIVKESNLKGAAFRTHPS